MRLITIKEIKGRIVLKSGLHIGSGDMEMKIGGTDNPVIKHPHTLEPYIPGSSLKGKTRSLLEMRSGLMAFTEGKPLSIKALNQCKDIDAEQKLQGEKIIKLFGTSGADEVAIEKYGASRASFADAYLNEQWRMKAETRQWPLTEVKSENSINRIKGTAENPRFTERVPAGAEFRFCISLKKMADDEDLESFLLTGLKLLQMDALGGSGSRGYGKVEFIFDDEIDQKAFNAVSPL
ncbi:MAG: type III-A CRISPR-associated RAMP protein Csm3 [Pseudomonadota bacterium]